ncbi:MAG: tetratricopeptide repeat protein [Marinicellaceae bacterium]
MTKNEIPKVPLNINYKDYDLSVQKQFKKRIQYIQLLEKNQIEQSKYGWAIGQLGKTYQAYLKNDEARDSYINAIARQPNNYEWHYLLAHVYKNTGLYEKSTHHFREVLKIEEHIPAKIWLADVLIQQNNWLEANEINQNILKNNPNHAMALYNLALNAKNSEQYYSAIELLKKILKNQPQAYQVHYQLGIIYSKLNQSQLAQSHLSNVPDDNDLKISIHFNDPLMQEVSDLRIGVQNLIKKAMKSHKQGFHSQAIELLKNAINADPNRIDTFYNLAVIYNNTNQLEKAKQQILAINDHNSDHVYSLLAIINTKQNQYDKALENLNKALLIKPNSIEYLNRIGDIYISKKHINNAKEFYQKSIDINWEQDLTKLKLARVLLQNKGEAAVIKLLENSILSTKHEATKNNILSRIDLKDSEAYLNKTDSNKNIMTQETLAMVSAKNGYFKKAIFHQKNALKYAKNQNNIDRINQRLEAYQSKTTPIIAWQLNEPIIAN